VYSTFTPAHRGGSGTPLLCLHGFSDTWRTWELVLPALERAHDVLAVTLAGHAGGPTIDGEIDDALLADNIERALDSAGFRRAHIVGNSLGGFVALQLAERGRAETVVALAPAGGWAADDTSDQELLDLLVGMHELLGSVAPHAAAILATPAGRRRVTELITTNFEHLPIELLAHLLQGAAGCTAALPLIEHARRGSWQLRPERIPCPVRIVWGTDDRLLPWPSAAVRYRDEWLPHADWAELDGVGHCPQLDVPALAAELVLGFTGR